MLGIGDPCDEVWAALEKCKAERDEAVQLLRQCLRELSWYEAHDDLHAAIDRLLSRMEEPHE